MEFTINGHNLSISDRFYEYASEKVDKLDHLKDKIQRIEAKVTKEKNPRVADTALTVELTVVAKGPAIRSEAVAGDKFAAFDAAYAKLLERLRKAKDKRKIHYGRHSPKPAKDATAGLDIVPAVLTSDVSVELESREPYDERDQGVDSPVLIRHKVFPASVMTLDDAVDNMELVGHDFYLFIDAETKAPSAVYRRRGWTYGVISLDTGDLGAALTEGIHPYRSQSRAEAS